MNVLSKYLHLTMSFKIVKNTFTFLLSYSIFFFAPSYASDSLEKVSLQLSWKYQFEFAGFIMAKEKGFYKDAGLDVELLEYQNGLSIVSDVLSQKVDFGIHNANVVVENKKIIPTVLLASYFQQSPLVIVSHKSISTPKQLIGKTVMGSEEEFMSSSLALLFDHFYINNQNSTLVDHSFGIDDFINNKVDAMTAYTTNELYELERLNIDYNVIDPVSYGISMTAVNLFTSKEQLLAHPDRTRDFVSASNKGWQYAISHLDETLSIIKEHYAKDKSKDALEFEAKASIRLMLLDFFNIGETSRELSLRVVKQLKYSGLIAKDEELGPMLINEVLLAANNAAYFNERQLKYLNEKKVITMCIDPEWMPFESINNGKHIGITADVMALFNQQLPIPITLVPTKNWNESLLKAKQRECDIFSLAASTPERLAYMDFTAPYIDLPVVMATKMNVRFIDDIKKVKHQAIGVVKGYAIANQLRSQLPDINIVDVSSISEGLERVEKGELFGYIDNLMVISDAIQKEFTGELKVSSRLDEGVKLAIGTRNDQTQLHNIFQILINNLSPDDLQVIYNRWVANNIVEPELDYGILWKLLLMVLFLLIVYYLHVSRLKRINEQLHTLSVTDRLTGIYNRVKTDQLLIEKKADVDRYESDVAIILFDIDLFKGVNDKYGHLAGDSVLVDFAKILKYNIRATDFAGRWGGEEFIIICPNIDINEACQLAEKLLNKIRSHTFSEVGNLTASAGVSRLSKHESIQSTIRKSDQALYQSKENGRNQVSILS